MTHEEPVPHRNPALRRHVGHGPVEQARHHPPAAVRYVDEGDPVAAGRHHRSQHDDVAAEADPAVTVAGGLGQVDDVGVRGGGGIDGVVRHRVDPLVGADVAELGAALVRLALNDLQTNQTHGAHPRSRILENRPRRTPVPDRAKHPARATGTTGLAPSHAGTDHGRMTARCSLPPSPDPDAGRPRR